MIAQAIVRLAKFENKGTTEEGKTNLNEQTNKKKKEGKLLYQCNCAHIKLLKNQMVVII